MRMKMRDYGWKWNSPHRLTAVLQINPSNLEGKTSFIADTLEQRFIGTAATPAEKRFLNAVSRVGSGGGMIGGEFTGCLSRWLSKSLWQCWSISQCVHTGGEGWGVAAVSREVPSVPPTHQHQPSNPLENRSKRKIPPTPNTVAG